MAATGMRRLGSGQPTAASVPARPRLRPLRTPRGRRHDRPSRRDRTHDGRAAVATGPRSSMRSAPRTNAGTAAGGRASSRATTFRSLPGSRTSPSSSRSRTGSAAFHAARRLARSGAAGTSIRCSPSLVEAEADVILSGLDTVGAWGAVIDAEPALAVVLDRRAASTPRCSRSRNFVDLKSPYFLGHAEPSPSSQPRRAPGSGSPRPMSDSLRRAGLVHGLGRLGISNAILDKRGPLGAGEWERVRLQPYLTDRMLRQSEALAPVARIAVQHRERLDGSGYPRGLSGAAISREARILAAADAYQAMREPRPHRPERTAEEAAAELRADVKAGRYDADAVEAVLGAAGHRVARRREGPAGLTPREVEVLRLLARGLSNKEIADAARDLPEDGRQPRRAHLREDQRLDPRRRRPVRDATRPAARGGVPRGASRPEPFSRPASPACSSSSPPRSCAAPRRG